MEQAFGNDLANELIESYAGSNLISDSQQDLIGEKYLAEQIKRIQEQQKTSSIMDKWSHLLYEGTKDRPSSTTASTTTTVTATANPKERLSTPLQSVKSAKSNKTTPASTKPPTPTPQRLLSSSSSQQKVSSTAVATEKPQISVISQLPSFQYAAVSPQIKLSSPKPSSRQPSVQKLRKGDSGDGKVTPTTSKPAEIVFEISTPEEVAVEPHNQQQQQQQQPQASEYDYQSATQSQSYLPQFSSSNLNSITIDAYNSPQFRAMLEQLTKPINVPPEQINYPPEWPSQEKICTNCQSYKRFIICIRLFSINKNICEFLQICWPNQFTFRHHSRSSYLHPTYTLLPITISQLWDKVAIIFLLTDFDSVFDSF